MKALQGFRCASTRLWVGWTLASSIILGCLPHIEQAVGGQLPDPRQGWKFRFRDFVIAAWSPPGASGAEYSLYRSAGFNLIMSPRYSFPQESLDLAQKHGLKVMVDTYTPNDQPWGGKADKYTPHPSHHPATLTELKWLHARIGRHPALAGYLLGDDIGAVPQELIDTTDFLRKNAPHLFPWICQCNYVYDDLARNGNPLADPQIYPTLYHSALPAFVQGQEYCATLDNLRRQCMKLRLISWPMFNVCGPGSPTFGTYGVVSDAMLRFQPYCALAYGAKGIWYFTFACLYNKAESPPKLTPGLAIVSEVNHRVAAWGACLLDCEATGVFHTGFPVTSGLSPADRQFVRKMSEDLLVGVLVSKDRSVYAMVVDKRLNTISGQPAARQVTVEFSHDVTSIHVMPSPGAAPRTLRHPSITLSLPAGGGELLKLQGPSLSSKAEKVTTEANPMLRHTGKVGPKGLLLHLSFDEGQGNVAHDTSGANNHALLNRAKWATGKIGGALDLRGQDDSAAVGFAFLPASEAMTVSCWVNPTYPKEGYGPVVLIGSGGVDRFEFGFGPDNLYPVLTDQKTHSEGRLYIDGMKQLIPEGTWGHVGIAAGPRGATVYLNGVARRQTDYVGTFEFQTKVIQLGCRYGENYIGLLDELRIYNRCLSAEEIRKLYESGG